MWLARIFDIDQNVISIYHNKDIKLLSKDLIDIASKTSWYIEKAKKHDLVLQVAVSGVKNNLLLIVFLDFLPMIGTSEIQLGKPLGLA